MYLQKIATEKLIVLVVAHRETIIPFFEEDKIIKPTGHCDESSSKQTGDAEPMIP